MNAIATPTDLLLGRNPRGARDHFHYFVQNELHAVRQGAWKLILSNRKVFYGYVKDRGGNDVELYDLGRDIGETKNVARENPAVVEKLLELAQSFPWPEKLLDPRIGLPVTPAAPKQPKRSAF